MTSSGVRQTIAEALNDAVRELVDGELPDLELGRARNRAHGDYASPAALKLARVMRQAPPQIATQIVERLRIADGAATAEAVGGYVNFRIGAGWLRDLVRRVAAEGPRYGQRDLGAGERVQVEFVSTNPTGPLHIGHGRGAILGDTLARLLEFTGHAVEREYYVNDYGTQALKFGQSILARMLGEEPPAGGYSGEYVDALAREAERNLRNVLELPRQEATLQVQRWAVARVLERFRKTLARLGVHFDVWFSEASLWTEGAAAPTALAELQRAGVLREREGARWFVMQDDDDEETQEDRVVIRRDGQPTYFASDLGYLIDRFRSREFHRVIELWGADHHGYVARMKAAAGALGIDAERLVIILMQLVHLKGGRMSKREGRLVTLDELVDMVGADAVRYFFLLRSPESTMEFDLDLAVAQSNENPVYYAQYAYARLANVDKVAREKELPDEADLELLVEPHELDLARQIAFWPEAVAEAAALLEPHRIPYYVHDLADAVHGFYQAGNRDWSHRVVVDDPALTRARVELCHAAQNTLKSALDLMGVSAPERM